MKNNHTTTILIFSIIITIVVACLIVFSLRVIKNKNIHTSAVITTLQEKMQEKEDTTIFAEKFTEIELTRDSINSHFVDPNNINKFVDYLENLGLNMGSEVLVKSIEVPANTQNTISFKVTINGTFQKVSATIALLENIPYQVEITQIYLNKDMKQQEQEDIKKVIILDVPTWQADVSFNILSAD